MSSLGQLDGELRIDGFGVVAVKIFRSDKNSCGQLIFVQELRDFGNKRNAFSHSFDLDITMLFDDEFAEEHSLVES